MGLKVAVAPSLTIGCPRTMSVEETATMSNLSTKASTRPQWLALALIISIGILSPLTNASSTAKRLNSQSPTMSRALQLVFADSSSFGTPPKWLAPSIAHKFGML